jgi:SAM-dependent methyltransferase
MTIDTDQARKDVQQYYGEVLASSSDLRTSACCSPDALAPWLKRLVSDVHPEVRDRFYGCGSPIPEAIEGLTVLDLGCGTGRDAYVLARLVGPSGRVIGVDMTAEQLAVAERHLDWHRDRYAGEMGSVEFRHGQIEDLGALGIGDGEVDVVISNCVLNLAADKEPVFAEVRRVLRPGGELLVSDVFADRRIPADLAADPVLRGECLGGALYWEDFRRILARLGVDDVRVTARSPITNDDEELAAKVGMIGFESVTYRAFKLDLEDRCEDYGHVATYLGTIPHQPHAFSLDDHHTFPTGKPALVCGNTADMLVATRYATHFGVTGDKSVHHGLFDCGPGAGASPANPPSSAGLCC